jgi:methionyl-tRNA synthetase
VSDECFYTETQITEVSPVNDPQKSYYVATETNSQVEWTREENYMFKLSAFQQRLIEHLKENHDFIYPPVRHQEVLEYLQASPLKDLSISRLKSRLSWGIPVPDDPEHTIYVWFEALISYLTAVGYPWSESGVSAWPADLQVIGKEIVRWVIPVLKACTRGLLIIYSFHAVYFPAMLMALDMPLPKHLLTHSHWTVDKKKMSKSVGNAVSPFKALAKYGPDIVRFYLARVGGRFRHDVGALRSVSLVFLFVLTDHPT